MNSKDKEVNKGEGELSNKGEGQTTDKNQKEVTTVTSVLEFLKWVEKLNGTEILFRGQSCCAWKVESGARRIHKSETATKGETSHNRNIIDRAEIQGVYDESISKITNTDWGLLAQQQHQGAATSLLDFSASPLVALFFACQECPKKYKCECVFLRSSKCNNCKKYSKEKTCKCKQQGGKVYSMVVDDPNQFDEFDSLSKLQDKKNYKVENVITGHKSVYWKPGHINNRIIAQHSYFVVGGQIGNFQEYFIPESLKSCILATLYKFYDIKRTNLFPDESGFAESKSVRPQYTVVYLEYLDAGLKFHRSGKYDRAIERYTKIIDSKGYKNPYKIQAYNYRGVSKLSWGDVYQESGVYDKAEEKYHEAIEDLEHVEKRSAEIYNNLGLVRYSLGQNKIKLVQIKKAIKEYELASKNFQASLTLNELSSETYNNIGLLNRGWADIYLILGNTEKRDELLKKAIISFNQSINLDPYNADIYNNRGDIWMDLGDNQKALIDANYAIELNHRHYPAYANRAIIKAGIISDKYTSNKYEGQHSKLIMDYKDAILDCNASILFYPYYWRAYSIRGTIKSLLEEHESADEDFAQAFAINSNALAVYNPCITLLLHLVSHKKELEDYKGALDTCRWLLKYYEIVYEDNINNNEIELFIRKKKEVVEQQIKELENHI